MPASIQVLEASFLASAASAEGLPPPAFAEVAFAGRSNVGKSSLINCLVQRRKLVRTSSTPGCTRAIQLFRARVRAGTDGAAGEVAELDLVDLPGYGFAKVSKRERRSWGPLIEGFLTHRPGLRAVVVLVDARRGIEEDDRELLDFVSHVRRTAIVVATKIDKLPSAQRTRRVAEIGREAGTRAIGFSSETGDGRDDLWRAILRVAQIALGPPLQPPERGADT